MSNSWFTAPNLQVFRLASTLTVFRDCSNLYNLSQLTITIRAAAFGNAASTSRNGLANPQLGDHGAPLFVVALNRTDSAQVAVYCVPGGQHRIGHRQCNCSLDCGYQLGELIERTRPCFSGCACLFHPSGRRNRP